MSSYTNIFGNFNVQPSQSSYSSYTINVNLALTWPLQFIDTTNIVSNIIDVNATIGGLTVQMPDATQGSVGNSVIFNNVGANTFNVVKNDNTLLITLLAGQSAFVYLVNNTTTAGIYRTTPFGGGFVSVTSVSAVSTSNNLTIAGSPITNAGTFTFSLANDLLALSSFGGNTGLASRTAANAWSLLTLTGTANQINIVNPQGILGNPTFSLSNIITGINSATIGNININANTISTTNANGDLLIMPNGTGVLRSFSTEILMGASQLRFNNGANSGYVGFQAGAVALGGATVWTLPLTDGNAGQVIQTNGARVLSFASVVNFNGPSTDNAIAKYQGINGALQNSGVIIDPANNITGVNSLVAQNIRIAGAAANSIDIANVNGSLNIFANGTGNITLNTTAPGETQNFGLLTMRPVAAAVTPLRFYNAANTFYTGFQAANPAANVNWILPAVDGGINALMLSNGAGTLGWTPAGAGKLVLISSQVAANSANISFGANAGTFPVYNCYRLVINNMVPATNNVTLNLIISIDGGAAFITTANYRYGYNVASTAPSTQNVGASAQTAIICCSRTDDNAKLSNVANTPANFIIDIMNANVNNFTYFQMSSSYNFSDASNSAFGTGGGLYAVAAIVNGLRFLMSAGNITSGTFTLYGLNT